MSFPGFCEPTPRSRWTVFWEKGLSPHCPPSVQPLPSALATTTDIETQAGALLAAVQTNDMAQRKIWPSMVRSFFAARRPYDSILWAAIDASKIRIVPVGSPNSGCSLIFALIFKTWRSKVKGGLPAAPFILRRTSVRRFAAQMALFSPELRT